MQRTSGTFSVFKGKGAAKFILMYPQRGPVRTLRNGDQAQGFVTKNGGVLLEAAPVVGKRPDGLPNVDWSQKITFGIGVPDIAQLLDRSVDRLFHKDPKDGTTKTLEFKPGTGQYAGSMNMYLNQTKNGQKSSVYVPFSEGEFGVLQRLLVAALPIMLGWSE